MFINKDIILYSFLHVPFLSWYCSKLSILVLKIRNEAECKKFLSTKLFWKKFYNHQFGDSMISIYIIHYILQTIEGKLLKCGTLLSELFFKKFRKLWLWVHWNSIRPLVLEENLSSRSSKSSSSTWDSVLHSFYFSSDNWMCWWVN